MQGVDHPRPHTYRPGLASDRFRDFALANARVEAFDFGRGWSPSPYEDLKQSAIVFAAMSWDAAMRPEQILRSE